MREIKVDAPGLEAQPVTYGKALRNHEFYNISDVVPGGFEGVPEAVLDTEYTRWRAQVPHPPKHLWTLA